MNVCPQPHCTFWLRGVRQHREMREEEWGLVSPLDFIVLDMEAESARNFFQCLQAHPTTQIVGSAQATMLAGKMTYLEIPGIALTSGISTLIPNSLARGIRAVSRIWG